MYRTKQGENLVSGSKVKVSKDGNVLAAVVEDIREGKLYLYAPFPNVAFSISENRGWTVELLKPARPDWSYEVGCIVKNSVGIAFERTLDDMWVAAGGVKKMTWNEISVLTPLTRYVKSEQTYP